MELKDSTTYPCPLGVANYSRLREKAKANGAGGQEEKKRLIVTKATSHNARYAKKPRCHFILHRGFST